MQITLDREELLTVLHLVEGRVMEHQRLMSHCAPEGMIATEWAEQYLLSEQRIAALTPLWKRLRAAEEASRKPLDPAADFCGMTFED